MKNILRSTAIYRPRSVVLSKNNKLVQAEFDTELAD
jgi:hypothetical protein